MSQFARGTDNGTEYERKDDSFYKGIVVKNWDPSKLQRVKIYIPELSNQPLQNWLQEYREMHIRFPGENNKQDNWGGDGIEIYREISKFLPWAEQCVSLLGENAPGRHYAPEGIATTLDTNYPDTFQTNNEDPPTEAGGAWGPSFLYENYATNEADYFSYPTDEGNYAVNNNPYSYQYRPSNQIDKPKGVYCVPSVGSQVWVFHYRGDYNFPVYFGGRHSLRETALIYDKDAGETPYDPSTTETGIKGATLNASMDYPGIFENFDNKSDKITRTKSTEE